MEPIAIVGLAASILAFVEFGARVVERLEELSNAGDVPKVFRDVRMRLPIILQVVERVRDTSRDLHPDTRTAVDEVIRNCHELVEKLQKILDAVTVKPNDSRWRRGTTAVISLIQEERVDRIATALKSNVDLLVSLHIAPAEKKAKSDERRPSEQTIAPPTYESSQIHFIVPFERDPDFVGRIEELDAVTANFLNLRKVGIVGIGGVGKSQVTVEFCYRFRDLEPQSHIFWVFGGNAARFKQDYKRIAQALQIPGIDDPDVNLLKLAADSLSNLASPYLLVLDNADNMKDWWTSKYASMVPDDNEPSHNLADFLPNCGEQGRLLVTTRDTRIASRLTGQKKPISILPMSKEDAQQLFLCRVGGEGYDEEEVGKLIEELGFLPLAISQAAAYLEQYEYFSISEYLEALKTDEEGDEFLQEELDDVRRHQDSFNSIFRTWKISFDQIRRQKPKAAELLMVMSMLDRQNIAKSLLSSTDEFKSELATSLGTLQSFHMITLRDNKASFQMHRLVHRFVRSHSRRSKEAEKRRATALKCVAAAYPVEIGPAEYDLCESLTPHVLELVSHTYSTDDANLDLATLLCWSADFAIEKSEYALGITRASKSLEIFQRLVPETDVRRASAAWVYGRLLFFQAVSEKDIEEAAAMLRIAFRSSPYKTLVYAESAFELAHLSFDQGRKDECLEMSKASYECWRDTEGRDSQRALDNLHDYALWLCLFGSITQGIAMFQEILKHCRTSHDSSEDTRKLYELRSFACIAEFSGDASLAEDLYQKLIDHCNVIYNDNQGHIYDYLITHCEQVVRQNRSEKALKLAQTILSSCESNSEWQLQVTCIDLIAECYRQDGNLQAEEQQRVAALAMHEENLTRTRPETIPSLGNLAHCLTRAKKYEKAAPLWEEVCKWRVERLGPQHPDTIRAQICWGACLAGSTQYAVAEEIFSAALKQQGEVTSLTLWNLCVVLWNQKKWNDLETRCREALRQWEDGAADNHTDTTVDLEQFNELLEIATEKRKAEVDALGSHMGDLSLEELMRARHTSMLSHCLLPPIPLPRRFNRILQTRTWSG